MPYSQLSPEEEELLMGALSSGPARGLPTQMQATAPTEEDLALLEPATVPKPATPEISPEEIAAYASGQEPPAPAPAPVEVPAAPTPEPAPASTSESSKSSYTERLSEVADQFNPMAARDAIDAQHTGAKPARATKEQEFSSRHYRPTDDDVQRAWALMTIAGNPGENFKIVDVLRNQQADYDEGLVKAREADYSESDAPLAMQERLGFGGNSAQSVGGLSRRDAEATSRMGGNMSAPYMRAVTTGAVEEGRATRDAANRESRERLAKAQMESREAMAKLRRPAGGSGAGAAGAGKGSAAPAGIDNEQLAAWISEREGVPLAMAAAYVNQDFESIPMTIDQIDGMTRAATLLTKMPLEMQQKRIFQDTGREGATIDRVAERAQAQTNRLAAMEAQTKATVERLKANPPARLKLRQEWTQMDQLLDSASDGWETLVANPKALEIVVRLGSTGYQGDVRDASLSPEEQVAASKLLRVVSRYAFSEGGKALTDTEKEILAGTSGLGLGPAQWFKSPQVLHSFLNQMQNSSNLYHDNIAKEYTGFWDQSE